jgi:hypothetical protein
MFSLLRRSDMFIALKSKAPLAPLGAICHIALLTERISVEAPSYKHQAPTEPASERNAFTKHQYGAVFRAQRIHKTSVRSRLQSATL